MDLYKRYLAPVGSREKSISDLSVCIHVDNIAVAAGFNFVTKTFVVDEGKRAG